MPRLGPPLESHFSSGRKSCQGKRRSGGACVWSTQVFRVGFTRLQQLPIKTKIIRNLHFNLIEMRKKGCNKQSNGAISTSKARHITAEAVNKKVASDPVSASFSPSGLDDREEEERTRVSLAAPT